MASISVAGDSSGSITIAAPAVAGSGTLTLPVATDTLIGKATTDTLTNKSIAATQLTGTIAASALPAGSVLQVVQGTYSTAISTSSASYVTTNLTASITPRSASSKILISVSFPSTNQNLGNQVTATIYRGATNLSVSGTNLNGFGQTYNGAGNSQANYSMCFLDSPSTTSSTTYTAYYASTNTGTVAAFINNQTGTITLMEIAG